MTTSTTQGVDFREQLRQLLSEGGGGTPQRAVGKTLPTKPYRLTFGTHWIPNPEFVPESVMAPELSHLVCNVGDVVQLTDDQYKSFKDKFAPVDEGGVGVRDAEAEVLENAKKTAEKTGEMVNPNQPIQASKNPLIEEQKAREAAAKKG